jgi:hypothetical protein
MNLMTLNAKPHENTPNLARRLLSARGAELHIPSSQGRIRHKTRGKDTKQLRRRPSPASSSSSLPSPHDTIACPRLQQQGAHIAGGLRGRDSRGIPDGAWFGVAPDPMDARMARQDGMAFCRTPKRKTHLTGYSTHGW